MVEEFVLAPSLASISVQIKNVKKKQDANTKVFLSYNKVVKTII